MLSLQGDSSLGKEGYLCQTDLAGVADSCWLTLQIWSWCLQGEAGGLVFKLPARLPHLFITDLMWTEGLNWEKVLWQRVELPCYTC